MPVTPARTTLPLSPSHPPALAWRLPRNVNSIRDGCFLPPTAPRRLHCRHNGVPGLHAVRESREEPQLFLWIFSTLLTLGLLYCTMAHSICLFANRVWLFAITRANTVTFADWKLSVLITMAMYGSVDSHPGVGLRPTPRATRQVAFFLAGLALVAVVAIGYHLYDMQ